MYYVFSRNLFDQGIYSLIQDAIDMATDLNRAISEANTWHQGDMDDRASTGADAKHYVVLNGNQEVVYDTAETYGE